MPTRPGCATCAPSPPAPCPPPADCVLDAYDAFLRDPRLAARLQPRLVLRVGAAPTSRPLLTFLHQHRSARHVLVDGDAGWNEPDQLATDVLHVDPAGLCAA